jgi:hypothetical protein
MRRGFLFHTIKMIDASPWSLDEKSLIVREIATF